MTTGTVINSICPFGFSCTDKGIKCGSCKHNPQRSWYEPITPYEPYLPFYPIYPSYPYYPALPYYVTYTIADCTSDTSKPSVGTNDIS
jgi:hypothetical protein